MHGVVPGDATNVPKQLEQGTFEQKGRRRGGIARLESLLTRLIMSTGSFVRTCTCKYVHLQVQTGQPTNGRAIVFQISNNLGLLKTEANLRLL